MTESVLSKRFSLVRSFTENKENAYAVAFSSDGKTFAAGGGLRAVFIYDLLNDKAIGGLADHSQSIYSIKFSENGMWFFSTGRDGKVLVYDTKQYDKITDLLPEFDLSTAHPQQIPNYSLALSPDENILAVGGSGGVLRLYKTIDWSVFKIIPLHKGNIRSICFSPNGELLATGSSDNTVIISDAQTFEPIQTLEGHGDSVFSTLFSPDGKLFATGGKDARLRIWSVEGRNLIPKVKIIAHTFAIKSMRFLNNSNELITVSQDKTIKLWDLNLMKAIESIDKHLEGHSFTINSVDVSHDNNYMVTGSDDKLVKLWKLS